MERFLSSLAGIRSARVVAREAGTLDEIHILCAPSLQPKQVVRNVESALCAGLGMRIDRRIVSVAQLREEIEPAPARAPAPAAPAPAGAPGGRVRDAAPHEPEAPAAHRAGLEPAPERESATHTEPAARRAADASASAEPSRRFLFVGYDASIAGGRTTCRVTIRRARQLFTGSGGGSNTSQGRAIAAAEAVLNAVGDAAAEGTLGLDGASITELGGRPYVLVSALGLDGRQNTRLTGVAALVRSPEEAAILAGLQAANRWSETR